MATTYLRLGRDCRSPHGTIFAYLSYLTDIHQSFHVSFACLKFGLLRTRKEPRSCSTPRPTGKCNFIPQDELLHCAPGHYGDGWRPAAGARGRLAATRSRNHRRPHRPVIYPTTASRWTRLRVLAGSYRRYSTTHESLPL
ncbi:hypothetical protein EVAR_24541_1 [Eumeta japonica]|uniref:Uncharacterized protein n=1 Tax=Eumeta variegata TaxID=151549 RepID=A0A4C1UQZ3_EUMVA|nr:hypothetical protein EVAR_24541_1 [Eumeta japonica]